MFFQFEVFSREILDLMSQLAKKYSSAMYVLSPAETPCLASS